MDKAQIEHLICLIKNENFNIAQRKGTLINQVKQAARRCNQHIYTAAERLDLPTNGHTAKHSVDANLNLAGIIAERLRNLCRQFAGGRQNKHPAGQRRPRLGIVHQILERG